MLYFAFFLTKPRRCLKTNYKVLLVIFGVLANDFAHLPVTNIKRLE